MSEEVAQANGLLIEIARLRTDLAITRAALSQAERATEAERAARMRAGADAGALWLALERLLMFVTAGRTLPDSDRVLIGRANARPIIPAHSFSPS